MVETHWICDVCGKRVIDSGQTKNNCETGIQDWFSVNLSIVSVKNPLSSEKHVYKYGYACSEECLGKVIDLLKNYATDILRNKKGL